MIEFAIVAPLFFLLIFGLMESAAAFHSRGTMGTAVGDFARKGSIARDNANADIEIVEGIVARSGNAISTNVKRVVVYKAESINSEPPQSCKDGTSSDICNIYDGANLTSVPPCGGGWCPSQRNADDLLGVWVLSTFEGMTGISPFNFDWTDRAVTLVEVPVG